jgi:hypothetical protein
MAARDELVAAVTDRYARGDRGERGRILDEFAEITGYHRKHAMRLLRVGQMNRRCGPRPGRRIYDEAVREALGCWCSDRASSRHHYGRMEYGKARLRVESDRADEL